MSDPLKHVPPATELLPVLGSVALLVRDYDEAIAFFTTCLDFTLEADERLTEEKRWVRVRPPGGSTSVLLARAATPRQLASVGQQAGGRVFLFLETGDCWRDYRRYQARGVHFEQAPRRESYGLVAVFQDLCGNRWDLIQPQSTLIRANE